MGVMAFPLNVTPGFTSVPGGWLSIQAAPVLYAGGPPPSRACILRLYSTKKRREKKKILLN